jgi:hypothetical protein
MVARALSAIDRVSSSFHIRTLYEGVDGGQLEATVDLLSALEGLAGNEARLDHLLYVSVREPEVLGQPSQVDPWFRIGNGGSS